MTTNIERQFFDTFGIEPKEKVRQIFNGAEFKVETIKDYPQITDTHYLQLVCWVNERRIFQNFDVNGLKEYVLKELCTMAVTEQFKQQVQELFKEG